MHVLHSSFLGRLCLWVIAKLPFAALPLLINALIWVIVHKVTVWPLLKVEDLSYFAIHVSGETVVGLMVQGRIRREIRPLLFVLPFLVAMGAAILLGYWHHETADPDANALFTPIVQRLVGIGALFSTVSLVCAALYLFHSEDGPEAVPRPDVWFTGRVLFALFPCLVSGFFAFLTPTPYQVWRVNDLCFFAIAVSGPAIIDLTRSQTESTIPQVIRLVPLIVAIVFSSIILGSWYFSAALPVEPAVNQRVVLILLRSAQISALCTIIAAGFVEMYAWHHTRSAAEAENTNGGAT